MRVLIRREGAFGDVLCTTPIAHRFREQGHVVHVETRHPEAYDGNRDVEWVGYSARDAYDKVVDLNGSYERRMRREHAIDCYMEDAFGDRDGDKTIRVAKVARPYIYALTDKPNYVTVHPAVSWRNRTLPRDFWQKVAREIAFRGYEVVAVGTKQDHALGGVVDTRGVLTAQRQAAVIGASRAFVGSDSGALVLAASTDVPMVTLLTITDTTMTKFWRHGEWQWKVDAIMPNLPCVNCSARLDRPVTHHDCERGDFACVTMFDAEVVAARVADVADRR